MFTRTRFQEGTLIREKRQRQADVWAYRWREMDDNGSIKRRKVIVGTVEQYRTESHARKALAALHLNVNQHRSDGAYPALMTVGQLVKHYKIHELGADRLSKAQSTVDVYHYYLRSWIEPHWGQYRVLDMKPVEVEAWLHSLRVADGTKAKIRNVMSTLFQHGLRHQFITKNPIKGLVRQSAKRQRDPDILLAKEIGAILKRLSPLPRTMVFLAAGTGLRFSEIRGLQWQDIDWDAGVLNLRRGVVNKHITELKTKASRKPVPLHPTLMEALRSYKAQTAYNKPTDWVFASTKAKGKVSVWPSCIMSDYIIPAAKDAKIEKHIHWHAFRHAYGSLLKANGEDVKVVQDSLRHANSQITMDTYVQAIPAAVRSAHGRVVEQIAATAAELLSVGPTMDPSVAAVSVSY
jgi:integrase